MSVWLFRIGINGCLRRIPRVIGTIVRASASA